MVALASLKELQGRADGEYDAFYFKLGEWEGWTQLIQDGIVGFILDDNLRVIFAEDIGGRLLNVL